MISVITPVFNGEAHIEDCLNVVIKQNCSDLEHLVVDGNSSDRTMEIVRSYAEKYPHIRWISERDKGQSDAMNKGVAAAKGNILAILNVDDFYEPGTLNRIIEIFKSLPDPSLLVGNCNVWDSNGNFKYLNRPSKLSITDLLMGWSINPHPVNPAAYFYHKSVHDLIGPYEVENHFAMDVDFLFKTVKVANVKYVDETFGDYRLLEGTKTVRDQQSGENVARMQNLVSLHMQKLPLLLQFKVIAFKHGINSYTTFREFVRGIRRKVRNTLFKAK